MSPASQNESIGIVAKYIIQIWFIEEIKEVKCRSISSDEATSVYVQVWMCIYIYIYTYIYICMYIMFLS